MSMISFERALEIVMDNVFSTGTEVIPWTDSMDRILAEDITADTDQPPFDRSSVDGFACRKSDLDRELEIIETIPAGKWPSESVRAGQCSRIMTGAPVPEGADCVIMVEDTEILNPDRIKFKGPFLKENIAYRGEDVREGETVLRAGRPIKPQDIAVMASVGHVSVVVGKKPGVAVISSGSELVEPYEKPSRQGIRNSNSSQLIVQTTRTGAEGRYYGIAADDEEITLDLVSKAISDNEIVIITGGVSMGDFDFVPSVLEKAGVKILFDRIAVQPGKPTTFGVHDSGVVFGLPGNPVSSFIQFEMLVRPFIYKMMGYDWKPYEIRLPIREKFARKNAGRMALIPVAFTEDNSVVPVDYHGSAHISALPYADGIIRLGVEETVIEKGEIVNVRQF
jgi:molybdopterin molybdotransferase